MTLTGRGRADDHRPCVIRADEKEAGGHMAVASRFRFYVFRLRSSTGRVGV